jgi:hypothetical protein
MTVYVQLIIGCLITLVVKTDGWNSAAHFLSGVLIWDAIRVIHFRGQS